MNTEKNCKRFSRYFSVYSGTFDYLTAFEYNYDRKSLARLLKTELNTLKTKISLCSNGLITQRCKSLHRGLRPKAVAVRQIHRF